MTLRAKLQSRFAAIDAVSAAWMKYLDQNPHLIGAPRDRMKTAFDTWKSDNDVTRASFSEIMKALREKGFMLHGEWAEYPLRGNVLPTPRNPPQKSVIEGGRKICTVVRQHPCSCENTLLWHFLVLFSPAFKLAYRDPAPVLQMEAPLLHKLPAKKTKPNT